MQVVAQHQLSLADPQHRDVASKLQQTEESHRSLTLKDHKSAKSIGALKQQLEKQSAEYYREVELLKLSHEKGPILSAQDAPFY